MVPTVPPSNGIEKAGNIDSNIVKLVFLSQLNMLHERDGSNIFCNFIVQ